jgi:hypothetical protein
MPQLDDITITFEIEPIVKLTCMAFNCKHNAYMFRSATCDYKHVAIDADHQCQSFEKRAEDARSQTETDSQKET